MVKIVLLLSHLHINHGLVCVNQIHKQIDHMLHLCVTIMVNNAHNSIQCSLVKPPPSVQLVVWRYSEFGDKLRDIENRKLCDHMKR